MILKPHRSSLVTVPFVVLNLVLTLLLIVGGVAEAGAKLCGAAAEQAGTTSQSAERGTCCCCARPDKDPCSTGLKGGCGVNRKILPNAALLNVEGLSAAPSPPYLHLSPPSFSDENSLEPVFAQQTAYLINVKLLC
jgi:hypothetical protein